MINFLLPNRSDLCEIGSSMFCEAEYFPVSRQQSCIPETYEGVFGHSLFLKRQNLRLWFLRMLEFELSPSRNFLSKF